ncbi:MAG TPA: SDR family NAD(P)-dependent oxidoreductase [Acidimicrobiales bacterium]|jgi:NAD(P)-dependent dehydrogenase (short-subunit alcohol dehydrogenase family)|nr:SDR family NAD(P)-dependent oxidoreductase [Acidimicrobiales bacterium]
MTTQTPANIPPIEDWSRLLEGRVTVVSGGGEGIGAAVARLFAEHGALIEIAEIDGDRAAAVGESIRAAGGSARAHVLDVTDDDSVAAFALDVLDTHGRVDVVVNNVGDYRPLVRFPESTPESWLAMYDINLRHVFAVTHAFIGAMIEQRRGSIVNVHSVEGMRGYPGDPVYGAMKAGVAHFTTCLAASVGRNGIRVNGIGPDLTQTPQVDYLTGFEDSEHLWPSWAPVGRLGWPEDQARAALFLASDLSSFVTGHNIPVDGGTKTGGGWFYSPIAHRFVNRPTTL